MIYVAQLEPMGCGPACVAMVLGEDYFTARARFKGRDDFTSKGLTHQALDRQLAKAGYATARIYPEPGVPWPPAPFARWHIARVRTPEMRGPRRIHHYVAVTAGGMIYDPADRFGKRSLRDYPRVLDVAGVFEI